MGSLPSIRKVWISLSLAVLLLGCSEEVHRVGMCSLTRDTVWSDMVIVEGDVYVPPGVTLTVVPGTLVKFRRIDESSGKNMFGVDSPYYPQAEIIVRGRIIARGTTKRPIIFTSAEVNAAPADWGAINLLGSRGNVIEHCKIICAYNGVHGHSAEASVLRSEFMKNGIAMSFKKEYEFPELPWYGADAELTASGNRIYRNKGGISFRAAKVDISRNQIEENKFFGLWIKEDCSGTVAYNTIRGNKKNVILYMASGIKISSNNIYDAADYNVAVAEEQEADVDFGGNWWGTINVRKIEDSIFDMSDDPDVARVLYEPMERKRIKGAGL